MLSWIPGECGCSLKEKVWEPTTRGSIRKHIWGWTENSSTSEGSIIPMLLSAMTAVLKLVCPLESAGKHYKCWFPVPSLKNFQIQWSWSKPEHQLFKKSLPGDSNMQSELGTVISSLLANNILIGLKKLCSQVYGCTMAKFWLYHAWVKVRLYRAGTRDCH